MGKAGMIRPALIVALLSLLGACSSPEPTYRDLERLGSEYERGGASPLGGDTCHLSQHHNLLGQNESAIDRSNLPEGARVICFGCAATRDDNPNRLTIQIGADHKVASLRCG
jgi:hypothetical protein